MKPLEPTILPEGQLTPPQKRCTEELTRLLGPDSDYYVGALVLSYRKPGAGDGDPSYAHTLGFATHHLKQAGADISGLPAVLRRMADDFEATLRGEKPLGITVKGMKAR